MASHLKPTALIENSSHGEAQLSESLAAILRIRGIAIALDDIGAKDTLLSLPVIMAADYLKLDRLLLRRRDRTCGHAGGPRR